MFHLTISQQLLHLSIMLILALGLSSPQPLPIRPLTPARASPPWQQPSFVPAAQAPPLERAASLTGEQAIAQLKATGHYDSLAAALTAARYTVQPVAGMDTTVWAQNPAHSLSSTFSPDGLTLTVRTGAGAQAPSYTVGWRLRSLGYGAAQMSVPAGTLHTAGQRIELARTMPAITEWYVNQTAGLEHGFTLPARPAANPRGERLRLVLAVSGDLTPQADRAGQSLTLRDAAGSTVLTYAALRVWDATGAQLPASMQVAAGQVTLAVADAAARYPLTIDPTFSQQAYLKASNTEEADWFGQTVAVSDDTVVVGAYYEDSNATGVNGNQSDNSAAESGAAYVFVRSGTVWSQQAYLKASNTDAGDYFGLRVAVSGNIVVVGAPFEASNATGVNGNQSDNSAGGAGAAYIFVASPEIAVEQPAGTDLTDGVASVAFGNLNMGASTSRVFAIKNVGMADLSGLGITIDGPDAALFSVTANPTSPVSGPDGSTTFTVRFAPTSIGAKIAALHIANNDVDENPFDLTLTGTGSYIIYLPHVAR